MNRYPQEHDAIGDACVLCGSGFRHGVGVSQWAHSFNAQSAERLPLLLIQIAEGYKILIESKPPWLTEKIAYDLGEIVAGLDHLNKAIDYTIPESWDCPLCRRTPKGRDHSRYWPGWEVYDPGYLALNLYCLNFGLHDECRKLSTWFPVDLHEKAHAIRNTAKQVQREMGFLICADCEYPVDSLCGFEDREVCEVCYQFHTEIKTMRMDGGFTIHPDGSESEVEEGDYIILDKREWKPGPV